MRFTLFTFLLTGFQFTFIDKETKQNKFITDSVRYVCLCVQTQIDYSAQTIDCKKKRNYLVINNERNTQRLASSGGCSLYS